LFAVVKKTGWTGWAPALDSSMRRQGRGREGAFALRCPPGRAPPAEPHVAMRPASGVQAGGGRGAEGRGGRLVGGKRRCESWGVGAVCELGCVGAAA
jgi:hypothetical protein